MSCKHFVLHSATKWTSPASAATHAQRLFWQASHASSRDSMLQCAPQLQHCAMGIQYISRKPIVPSGETASLPLGGDGVRAAPRLKRDSRAAPPTKDGKPQPASLVYKPGACRMA